MNKYLSIKKDEVHIFISLFLIISMIVFNTKILKILKDTIVVTTPEMGAELIPFLKTWLLIPISLLLICVVVRMMRMMSYLSVYLLTTAFFLTFYLSYVFILRPIQSSLTPHTIIAYIEPLIPQSLNKFLLIIEYWPICIFYVMCDIWPIIFLSMLFWKYASEVINHEQGKRFFPLFSIDIGGILMAPIMGLITYLSTSMVANGTKLWEVQLGSLTLLLTGVGIVQAVVFYKLYQTAGPITPPRNSKKKVPLKEVLEYARSPYFGSLAIIIFMFEFSDNLFDILWKDTLGNYRPEPENFSKYLGVVTTFTGILTTVTPFVLSRFLLQRLPWVKVAMITPTLRILLCIAFFGCLFFPNLAFSLGAPLGFSGLGFTVFIGGVQSSILHMAKCTVFDNTKDLAFMLASREEQASARAFSDALATKLGKSSSCLAQQGLLMSHATLQAASPIIASLIGFSIPIWLFSISMSNRYYQQRLTGITETPVEAA